MKRLVFVAIFMSILSFSLNSRPKTSAISDTINQKVDSANLTFMTTEQVINRIIDSEIYYLMLYSDETLAINSFKLNNKYYKELAKRNDFFDVLNNLILLLPKESIKYKNLLILQNIANDSYQYKLINRDSPLEDIYTPNGSVVQYSSYQTNTYDQMQIDAAHNYYTGLYPELVNSYFYPATDAFNCHSYAFYKQNASNNNRVIQLPTTYLNDYSYEEVFDVRPGDILCYWYYGYNSMPGFQTIDYFIGHSAIVTSVSDSFDITDYDTLEYINLISKWGYAGLYGHRGDRCPYAEDFQFVYLKAYRPRITESILLTNPTQNITTTTTKTCTIPQNSNISNNYSLYELNIGYSYNFDFCISSSNQLEIKLYSIQMQETTISLNSIYENGIYNYYFSSYLMSYIHYLRVSFLNNNDFGTITTNIYCHHYHNITSYEWYNLTYHHSICSCGFINENHVMPSNSLKKFPKLYTCALCGGPASISTPFKSKYSSSINENIMLNDDTIKLEGKDINTFLNKISIIFVDNNRFENKTPITYTKRKEHDYNKYEVDYEK